MPNFAAAPAGPETRPLVSAKTASMNSFSSFESVGLAAWGDDEASRTIHRS
jgi:hypothetical protein